MLLLVQGCLFNLDHVRLIIAVNIIAVASKIKLTIIPITIMKRVRRSFIAYTSISFGFISTIILESYN